MERGLVLDAGNGLTAGISKVVQRLQGDVLRRGTVTGAFGGLPVPAFNPIHIWEGAPSLADDLASVFEHANAARLKTRIVAPVGAEHEAVVLEVAQRYGYTPRVDTSPVMVLLDDQIPPLPRACPVSRRVSPLDRRTTCRDINAGDERRHRSGLQRGGSFIGT